ncbi:inositol monophosphatase [Pseudonocardia sp. RS11V-5]|uniref:inositol monophosphatase family protein n=1 Tax=Pseudonocardia terrae TaxID=2905831 RepID=UPI001E636A5D|nr:inositol monophosphatase family protein [Pseudonocardia terrae]MCE3553884.1 inositol monophosphatase [Pseudonocardia terrae]
MVPSSPPGTAGVPGTDTTTLPDAAELAELRRVAEQVAGEAAAHLRTLPAPRETGAVDTKSTPTDVVTESDQALERLVRDRLAQLRPSEPVYGEEAAGDAAAARWVVDPIDGTVNYLYGMPWYAVSVAAVRDGVSLAGAVVEPASGRVWSAAAGAGATCDGVPLGVTTETELSQALVACGFSYDAGRRARQAAMMAAVLPRVRDLRRTGSAALDLCGLAAGQLDAYVEHGIHWWDWAAAALVAREAGAVVQVRPAPGRPRTDGRELGEDVTVAAAPGVAAAFAELLREAGAAEV